MHFAWSLIDVGDIISNALRTLFAFLCELIYTGIATLYDLFVELGKLAYAAPLTKIYNKVSLIIGIFMVFRITFLLIESLVNPDNLNSKEKNPGKIIPKVLISVVLLATTPAIFEYAFNFQSKILESQIIEKIISIDKVYDAKSTGSVLSAQLFTNFYTPTYVVSATDGQSYIPEPDHKCMQFTGDEGGVIFDELRKYGNLTSLNNQCLLERYDNDDDNIDGKYVLNFNGLFATAVGFFVLWMILMYCLSLGVRYVQLIYLQIIAPIPIMCNLAPGKDNMLSKWFSQCTTTYLDLFIRSAIINFVMLLSNVILNNDYGILTSLQHDNWMIEVFLILGLLTFAKKVPDLIMELLPKSATKASGDFGFNLKKRADNMLGGKFMYSTLKRAPGYTAGGLLGATVGGVMGAAGGKGFGSRTAGFIGGAFRGFGTGSQKGSIIKNLGDVKKNQAAQNSKLQKWRIAAGKGENEANTFGDWWSRKTDAGRKAMGFETTAERNERNVKHAEGMNSIYKSNADYKKGKIREENTRIFVRDKKNGTQGFTTMTQLEANRDRLKVNYDQFDQKKDEMLAKARTKVKITADKETEFSRSAVAEVGNLSREEKINMMMELYNSNREAAEEQVDHYSDSADKDLQEELVRRKKEKYADEEATRIFEAEREQAFTAWDDARQLITDSEDFADFTYSAEQIAKNTSKREMFMNELAAYNEFVDSETPRELGIEGLEHISEQQIIDAFNAYEAGDATELERISKMYTGGMKSIPTKVTSFKNTSEYRGADANSKFNS